MPSHPLTYSVKQPKLRRDALVFVIFLLLTTALFTIVDYGNRDGADSWGHYYFASNMQLAYHTNRPVGLLPMLVFVRIFDLSPVAGHATVILVRTLSAFFLYLLVNHFAPKQQWMGYLTGVVYSLFFVEDWFFLLNFYSTGIIFSSLTLALLALHLYFQSVDNDRSILLLIAIALALTVCGMYEALIPLLFGLPITIFVLQGNYNRIRFVKLSIWGCAVIIGALWYALPILGLVDATYATGYQETISVGRIARRLHLHLAATLQPFIVFQAAKLPAYRLPVFLVNAMLMLGWFCLRESFAKQLQAQPMTRFTRFIGPALWILCGSLVWVLAIFAFIITPLADNVIRVHSITPFGVAIIATALILFVVQQVSKAGLKEAAIIIASLYVGTCGAIQVADLQQELYTLNSVWSDQAEYFRTLTQVAPKVEDETLFVHVQPRGRDDSPFIFGFGLQYAVQATYGEPVRALITNDLLTGSSWQVTADGVTVTQTHPSPPSFLYTNQHYSWDQVIFVTKDDNGRAQIFKSISAQSLDAFGAFNDYVDLTVIEQSAEQSYMPATRIQQAYVTQQVQKVYPPLQSLD